MKLLYVHDVANNITHSFNKNLGFQNLEALEEDITLLVDNAKNYNEEKSQIHKNAVTLFNFMKEKLQHYMNVEVSRSLTFDPDL